MKYFKICQENLFKLIYGLDSFSPHPNASNLTSPKFNKIQPSIPQPHLLPSLLNPPPQAFLYQNPLKFKQKMNASQLSISK